MIIKGVPDWALYAGGGVLLGGGYLLFKRRSAAAAANGAQSGTVNTAASGAITPDYTSQQPSIVPYYLTGGGGRNYGSSGGGVGTTTSLPLPTPSGPPADTGGGAGSLPPIAPILPPASTVVPTPAPTPTAPTPTVAAPTPSPAQNNNIPADLAARIAANGERIVSSLASPNGGVWYLGSKGGVFAINAPFYGSPVGQSYWGSRTGLQIVPNGAGYTVVDTAGERYNYGP